MNGPLNTNIDLSSTDTSFPSLEAGEYPMSVVGFTSKETKNAGQTMLRVELHLQAPAKDCKGNDISPGFPVFTNLTLPGAPGEEKQHRDIREKQITLFFDSVFKTSSPETRRASEWKGELSNEALNLAVGRIVKVVIKPSKDTTYGETEVKGFKAAA